MALCAARTDHAPVANHPRRLCAGRNADQQRHGARHPTRGTTLRIDINGDDFADLSINYSVPGSNPFAATAEARGEIYALGLRNPWRNSFDRQTGIPAAGGSAMWARARTKR